MNGKLLDIGAGSGTFLRGAADNGWKAYGIEPHFPGDEKASQLRIHRGSLADYTEPKESFETITLWHVLEHTETFKEIVQSAVRFLVPGGRLIIAVPNFASWECRIFRHRWALFDVPRHLLFFRPENVRELLKQNGLHIDRESYLSHEYNLPMTLQSTLNLLCTEPMFLYNIAKRQYRRSDFLQPDKYPQNLILSIVGTLIFLVPLAMFSFLAAVLRRGNVYTVKASKPSQPGA